MYVIAAFYLFTPLPGYADMRMPLKALAGSNGVTGTILLADEGINGTIAGPRSGVDAVLGHLRRLPGLSGLEHKESFAGQAPFKRMKVRLKKEIVTIGLAVNVRDDVGAYVDPADWNALISDPDVALVDARNEYEVEIGTFEGAIDPNTSSFGELPKWLDHLAKTTGKKKLAMYCTGGIRCEKSTAYAKSLGFDDVYHLKGGILKYLETVPADQSKWTGECYVFDRRVSVGHGLKQGHHTACNACGRPVNKDGEQHSGYEVGVSCAHCIDRYSDQDRKRFRDRQVQAEKTCPPKPALPFGR